MSQYTKHNSNYIRIKEHKTLNDSSKIFERDWVTLGSQQHFGPNKIPYYNDGNFIFTTSTLPSYQRKRKNGVNVATWNYDDIKKQLNGDLNNNNSITFYSDDIRSYCYYGSCVELIRTSIERILLTYPGYIITKKDNLFFGSFYEILNPFKLMIDALSISSIKETSDNKILSNNINSYKINDENIVKYNVIHRELHERIVEKRDSENKKYYETQHQMFSEKEYETVKSEGWYRVEYCNLNRWTPDNGNAVVEVEINNSFIKCYILEGNKIFFTENKELKILPKKEILDKFFKNLNSFERKLLNKDSKPYYTTTFKTILGDSEEYNIVNRYYTFPSFDGLLDISSLSYESYITELIDMAQRFDETFSNNLWRKMVHESLYRFDDLNREYNLEGNGEELAEGGERLHKVFNIIGRVFDDIKIKVDNVKKTNKITYDNDKNLNQNFLTKKLDLMGWDVNSIIPVYENKNKEKVSAKNLTIGKDILSNVDWFSSKSKENYTFENCNKEFLRNLILSSKYIQKTKGTVDSIYMILSLFGYGINDITVKESFYEVKPKKYSLIEDGEEESFGDRITEFNRRKEVYHKYDDNISGIPVGEFYIDEKNDKGEINQTSYLIPFYDKNKTYDGNIYFQSKGGWLCNNLIGDNSFNYVETWSYLKEVKNIDELLRLETPFVSVGDIYYVSDVNDYTSYSESDTLYSKFFVLVNDKRSYEFSSWKSIDLTGEKHTGDNIMLNYVKKANYLNNLITKNDNNNPHTGYGFYDKGETFFDYMRTPFRYSIVNNKFNLDDIEKAEDITFDISGEINSNELNHKIRVIGRKTKQEPETALFYGGKKDLKYISYDIEDINNFIKEKYYLNTKTVYIKNNIDNDNFKKYFNDVILNYIIQVIPSTTILIINNF